MDKHIFLYKIRDGLDLFESDADSRDCFAYLERNNLFHCGIDNGLIIHGSCYSRIGIPKNLQYEDVVTILLKEQFEYLRDKKYKNVVGFDEGNCYYNYLLVDNIVSSIQDRLLSDTNERLYNSLIELDKEYLMSAYDLSESDIKDIYDNNNLEYEDRSIISYVFDSVEDFGINEANSFGYIRNIPDEFGDCIDFMAYGNKRLEDGYAYELTDGRVVMFTQ